MNEIKIFENADLSVQVRTITDENGEPWFCLADVCKVLELQPSRVKDRLKENGITSSKVGVQTGFKQDGTPAIQNVDMTFINESNLYRVIMRSHKPQAEAFQDWVTSVVLPSIRKTGCYGQAEAARIAQATEYATIEQMKQILNIRPGSAKSLRIQRWLNEKYNLGQNLPTEEQFKAQKRAARIKRLEQRLAYLKGMGKTPRINREF